MPTFAYRKLIIFDVDWLGRFFSDLEAILQRSFDILMASSRSQGGVDVILKRLEAFLAQEEGCRRPIFDRPSVVFDQFCLRA